jgi:protein-L-isoaspartate(D-aspartate) O-methyltransferase
MGQLPRRKMVFSAESVLPFAERRALMVDSQLAARGLRDLSVLEAMRQVPRHLFVPEASVDEAYEDHPLSIGHGQTISQPYMVGLMTELLRAGPGKRILDVGTGSGYQAAVLGALGAQVLSVEYVPALAARAAAVLTRLGLSNVSVIAGDGSAPDFLKGEFDGIVVAAATDAVPGKLVRKLADGGRLLLPVGERQSQHLLLVERHGERFAEHRLLGCVFVPLRGEGGLDDGGDAKDGA